MNLKDYPDWHAVVQANWRKTTGYLLASKGSCLDVRDEELKAIRKNRVLVGVTAQDLEAWDPPKSWFMAVLLCPGDTTDLVSAWVRRHDVDPDRVHFYGVQDTDVFAALAAWNESGLPSPLVDDGIPSWRAFHQRFGRDLAVRILQDWALP